MSLSRLRGFPSDLLELPIQSTRCFLADVRPPDATDGPMMDDGCWPVSTMEALIQLVAGKKLVAKTMVRRRGIIYLLRINFFHSKEHTK